jgi:hypothetical protein
MSINQHGISADMIEIARKIMRGEKIEEKKKLDPVGQADADIDNDGDTDASDEYLHKRRKAIKKSMAKEEVELEEAAGYKAASEKSQFGGHRAHLKNPQGKTSYLGAAGYKKPEHAKGEAQAYHDAYFGGPGKANEHGAERAVAAYRAKHKDHMHVKEEVELDEKLETDGPKKPDIDKMISRTVKAHGNPKTAEYLSKKAGERRDMNKKNDPGAAKKGLALSVVDREKAKKKQMAHESEDMNADNAEKAVKHDCATHVVHKEHGEGRCIPGMHTLEEAKKECEHCDGTGKHGDEKCKSCDGTGYVMEGYVTHYDVMFQGEESPFIVEDIAVEDLEIVKEMSHGHKKKK